MIHLLIIVCSQKIGVVAIRILADFYDEMKRCWRDAVKKVPEEGHFVTLFTIWPQSLSRPARESQR